MSNSITGGVRVLTQSYTWNGVEDLGVPLSLIWHDASFRTARAVGPEALLGEPARRENSVGGLCVGGCGGVCGGVGGERGRHNGVGSVTGP